MALWATARISSSVELFSAKRVTAMIDDPLVIEEDWRLQACTRVVGISKQLAGEKMKVGDSIKAIANVEYGREPLIVGHPNSTALYLHLSFKQYEAAKKLLMGGVSRGLMAKGRVVPDGASFDFFEAIIAAIVFGYTALESFANEEIPEGFYHEKKYKKLWVAMGKESIERSVDLRTKLKEIIPRVHNVKSVASTAIWSEFLDLETTRDRIIHMKSADRQALGGRTDSIWHKLFRPDLICPHYVARRLMQYYYGQQKNPPRWSKLVPF